MRIVLPWAAVLLICCDAAAAAVTSGKLSKVQGRVWLQTPGADEGTADAGSTVPPGTRIRTGVDGSAEVSFDDGSWLQVQSNSTVQLSKSKRESRKSSIVLFFGRVWNKVTRSGTADSNYEVKTPNAVCGVRGTEFVASVADDGTARVRVDQGKVAVQGDGSGSDVGAGQQVDADENGVGSNQGATGDPQNQAWQNDRQERFKAQSERIVAKIKAKIMGRKERLEALRSQQRSLLDQRKQSESRAQQGDAGAAAEIRGLNQQLAQLSDAIADLGDEADSQFGIVDHFADLAGDPRFASVNRKTLEAEASSLRRIKGMFDQMVAEGTDISMKAMDDMMKDMHNGKRGSLKDKKGSSAKELFDE